MTAALLRASDANVKAADAEADRAMKWLTQAVAAGYSNVAHMKRDRDPNALRARPDFQKLVAELEAR